MWCGVQGRVVPVNPSCGPRTHQANTGLPALSPADSGGAGPRPFHRQGCHKAQQGAGPAQARAAVGRPRQNPRSWQKGHFRVVPGGIFTSLPLKIREEEACPSSQSHNHLQVGQIPTRHLLSHRYTSQEPGTWEVANRSAETVAPVGLWGERPSSGQCPLHSCLRLPRSIRDQTPAPRPQTPDPWSSGASIPFQHGCNFCPFEGAAACRVGDVVMRPSWGAAV